MKRQNILITACSLAAVSLGGNIWLLMHRNEKPEPLAQEKAPPALPTAAEFDFSDTAFADGSWKLSDESDVEAPVSLDKPFSFEEFKAPRDPATMEEKRLPDFGGTPDLRPQKLAGFLDTYHGDTPPDSPPPKK